MLEESADHTERTALHTGLNDIILTVISSLLNLYAKTFRCPDVLTSIYVLICLNTLYTPFQEFMHHDA
ncbi:hypothetical protein AV903_25005 [Erwinia tracheiphila]|uniref:Uncharacterized protein n=1 Tax=Erwinia tracheiphila TaxID=65700 RepID=A0A345CYK6_9GAMM|nr:hypothetical protein AV903_25005 [Erwinia tracheiphila]